jgi:hypothetical protein
MKLTTIKTQMFLSTDNDMKVVISRLRIKSLSILTYLNSQSLLVKKDLLLTYI